jgi:hypothetical protein
MPPVMIRYVIHIAYMGEMRSAYKVLDAKLEERAFGRCRMGKTATYRVVRVTRMTCSGSDDWIY